jgi:hypothetical protein
LYKTKGKTKKKLQTQALTLKLYTEVEKENKKNKSQCGALENCSYLSSLLLSQEKMLWMMKLLDLVIGICFLNYLE